MEHTSTLPAKIAAASLDVGGKLSADKRNTQNNYDYVSADKILSICGQALAQQGVIIFPDIITQELVNVEYGIGKSRWDARVEFLFHICDGTNEMVQKWFGMGSDYTVPDKALYKAITSGHKYFLSKLLCVGAGNEDGEHDESDKKPAAKPAAQVTPKADRPDKITDLTPQPEPSQAWLAEALVAIIVKYKLSMPNLVATLKYSNLPKTATAEQMDAWLTVYKEHRAAGEAPAIAADSANAS